jgi:hypothetical protein
MIRVLTTLIASRRAARRTAFAVAMLRKEAASHRRAKDKPMADYLDRLADLIEAVP